MSVTVIAFAVIALAVGALVGWLLGSREGAGAKQTVESLRLQLNEVVKERDANREAVTRLAALEASQLEREKGFEARIKELIEAKEGLSAQFSEISNRLLAEAQSASVLNHPNIFAVGNCRNAHVCRYRNQLDFVAVREGHVGILT